MFNSLIFGCVLAREIGSLHSKTLYWRVGFQPQAFSFEQGCSNTPATPNFLIWISSEGSVPLLPFPLAPPSLLPLVKGAERTCRYALALAE